MKHLTTCLTLIDSVSIRICISVSRLFKLLKLQSVISLEWQASKGKIERIQQVDFFLIPISPQWGDSSCLCGFSAHSECHILDKERKSPDITSRDKYVQKEIHQISCLNTLLHPLRHSYSKKSEPSLQGNLSSQIVHSLFSTFAFAKRQMRIY